ncbi:MAG: phosphatidic acid phosphatase, partial [Bacteroidota bacterium]
MASRIFCLIFLGLALFSCKPDNSYIEKIDDANYLHRSMKQLTDVIVHDIFSPPVASRLYVYPSIAAYEIIRQENEDNKSLHKQIRDLPSIPNAEDENINLPLASTKAFLIVSKALIFSEEKIDNFEAELLEEFNSIKIPKKVKAASFKYAEKVAAIILEWADKDNYKQTRTFPKYSITREDEKWQPTPPAYMDGIEPHWREIRPMVLESADQFVPPPPTDFSLEKNSKFYKEVMEVYETVKNRTTEQNDIAAFWDCNPYVSHQKGHVMFATKKITPGGHWVGITEIACKQSNASYLQSAEAYALTTIALFDA